MNRELRLYVVVAILVAGFGFVALDVRSAASDDSRGVAAGRQNACTSIGNVELNFGCRDLVVEVASAYLESIETPGIDYVPELPDLLAPDVKRWINRSYTYQQPNNDGREAVLAGVVNEPECTFPNKRWIVEGNVESGTASADFDAFCTGFPHAVIREWFRIENGLITEIEVRFVQVSCPTTAPWPCL